jgi:hypothetical protein
MEDEPPQMLQPDAGQRTLFSLSRVVRLNASAGCYTPEDVAELRAAILDVALPTQQVRARARARLRTPAPRSTRRPPTRLSPPRRRRRRRSSSPASASSTA